MNLEGERLCQRASWLCTFEVRSAFRSVPSPFGSSVTRLCSSLYCTVVMRVRSSPVKPAQSFLTLSRVSSGIPLVLLLAAGAGWGQGAAFTSRLAPDFFPDP